MDNSWMKFGTHVQRTPQPQASAPSGVVLHDLSIPDDIKVPNLFPTASSHYRIAIVGEAPGADEIQQRRPFVGSSGKFLDILLRANGIERHAVFLGNICQYRPLNNEITRFDWHGHQIQEGLAQLRDDLNVFKPNIVVCLGGSALRAFSGEALPITSWRGSLFSASGDSPRPGAKCIATYHPAACLRVYQWAPMLRFDLAKARRHAETPSLVLPLRHYETALTCDQIIDRLRAARSISSGQFGSFDLEGYWNRVTRFSIAPRSDYGFIVPFTAGEYDSAWTVDEEIRIWQATSEWAYDTNVPKCLQNSLYDRFVLAYKYRILLRNVRWDTMVGHWELYPELEKSLGVQASLYTDEPYWKEDRTADSLETRYIYCCKDSAVTEEIAETQVHTLKKRPANYAHANFNMELLDPLLYMELRGIRFDKQAADKEVVATKKVLYLKQHQLNTVANRALPPDMNAVFRRVRDTIGMKRYRLGCTNFGELRNYTLKDYIPAVERLHEMEQSGLFSNLDAAVLGEVEQLCDLGLNVDSNKQMVEFLYDELKYPVQTNEDRKTGKITRTADQMALLNLYRIKNDDTMKLVLKIRSALYVIQTLSVGVDPDGRVRCGYNLVGTETGRLSCYESPTGSGFNLQTVPKKLRYLFLADDGHYLFQCDLAGADGWTVAARCAALGDRTMLDDYYAGLKPAKLIALMYLGHKVNELSRDQLKSLSKDIKDGEATALCPHPWLYFGCKRVQHGSNYGLGKVTMSAQILEDSYKMTGEPLYLEPSLCEKLKLLYFSRYRGIHRWHSWVGTQLLTTGSMTAASGHTRTFMGRIKDKDGVCHATLREALANEPQDNTTYSCNRALSALWSDRENRRDNGSIWIKPTHQVHDAVIGQFPIDKADWAIPRIRRSFDNPLDIAGTRITIPFEGMYGPNWGPAEYGGGQVYRI